MNHIRSMNAYPLVIIIDLDGTIIGDITPQIMSFEVAKALKTSGAKVSYDTGDLKMKLGSGIIRPHFETFIKSLSSVMNIEFFVYTASEKTWAELVIKSVEAVAGIKFNRPIFTRNYCIQQDREYKKGLGFVRSHILRALKKKYGVLFTSKDLTSNMLIVDNNNVYARADYKHLVLCPTYSFRVPENVVANINIDMFKKYHSVVNSILKKYIHLSGTSDYHQFEKEFYSYYVDVLASQPKQATKYSTDRFWLHLRDIIINHKMNSFDESSVKYINTLLRQRLGIVSTTHTQSQSHSSLKQRLSHSTNVSMHNRHGKMVSKLNGKVDTTKHAFF